MSWNDLIGRQLGQYTIIEEIGRGGSSRVYRGHDADQLRDVAIKVILNDAEDRIGFVRRFEREVQAVAQLNHPNIVTVYDRGENDDLVYLVMQCVMGGTLRARLGRSLPSAEAANYVVQMAQALHHAHLRGIVHRDVKPSNMLIDGENPHHLLLTDFGIAKLQGARGLTKTGTTIGTPEYMAPEQAEGKEIDARADVYSLGCVLYEALSGRPPFTGSTPVSVLYQQVHSRPAYIRGFNPNVPRELTRVVEMALAKRPDDRYPTAESLAQALLPFAEESLALYPGFSTPVTGALGPKPPLPTDGAPPVSVLSRQWPPLASDQPPDPSWRGLGAEGLDAIFPEDAAAARPDGQAGKSGQESPPAHPTIPLPAFRLPARPSEPQRSPRARMDAQSQIGANPGNMDGADVLPGGDPSSYQEFFPGPAWEEPAADVFRYATDDEYGAWAARGNRYGSALDDGGEPKTSLRQAILETGQHRVVKEVWRPPEGALPVVPDSRRRPGSRSRTLRAGLAVAAALVLSVGAWIGISASGLGVTVAPHQSTKVALAPTSTPVPTATSTPAPTATSTPSAQQLLDKEAAAEFRAVTLNRGTDSACSTNITQFSAGDGIYVNICTSPTASPAPMKVAVEQNGRVMYPMLTESQLAQGTHYWYGQYGIPAGSYDLVVTVTINGKTATARDIPFTVG